MRAIARLGRRVVVERLQARHLLSGGVEQRLLELLARLKALLGDDAGASGRRGGEDGDQALSGTRSTLAAATSSYAIRMARGAETSTIPGQSSAGAA